MKIAPIQPFKNNENTNAVVSNLTGGSFQNLLEKALGEVNNLQLDSDKKALVFASGNPNIDVHDVMISMEKAQLALQLTIEIRNKLVEAYQEVMRMQV
ncbi:MAG: flagellar hook-basal body complex protein FliE [Bacillota bacterium]